MDWTGEHLIRSGPSTARRIREAQSRGSRRRIADSAYIAASSRGLTVKQAVAALGVSAVSIWKASKRLGISFGDGRRARG